MQNIDQEIKKLQDYQKLLEYKGEDRVVLASELLKEIATDVPKKIYNTKFTKLDEIIGGFRRGQLVVLSAATGEGKTTFAQGLTDKFTQDGERCLWFSYEVGIEEFMEKMPGSKAFYVPRVLRQGMLKWIEERIKEGIAKHKSRIIFIDHLHYLLEMQKMAEAKSLSLLIGMMLRELKRICIEQDVVIFLISHLRKIDMTEKPELTDLRDSSFVAQESDLILMLWRIRTRGMFPGEWIPSNDLRVAVRKNRRNGKLGIVSFKYENGLFEESDMPVNPNAPINHNEDEIKDLRF